ncbi:MAG TPA: type II toxin-antitoxin system prevent-host-death family antitoxin [Longimicrobiales bacterium]
MPRTQVGAYHAKTHLAELLDRVESGERITITRHGRPVADLVPTAGAPEMTVAEAIQGLCEFRQSHPRGSDLTLRQLIEEGRRF